MAKSELSTIRQLLRSRNLGSIREAVERVAELDDPELWDEVLRGAEWVKDDVRKRLSTRRTSKGTRMIGRIRPSHIFDSNGPSMLWDEMATMMLLANSKSPIREEVTHLTVTAEDFYEIELDLADLPKFPNLKHLDLALGTSRAAIEDTNALSTIETLRLRESVMRTDQTHPCLYLSNLLELDVIAFDPASELPLLVHLDAVNVSVPSLSNSMPKLESLRCSALIEPRIDVQPIEYVGTKGPHTPGLLVITDDLGSIGNLHGLTMLRVRSENQSLDVTPLLEATSLRAVDLRATTPVNLASLETHPELRYIAIDGSKIDKSSLTPALRKVVSVAKNVDLVKGGEKPHPSDRPKPQKAQRRSTNLDAAQKRVYSKVKKLLTTPDLSSILQGAEVIAGLGDQKIIDELLDGVTVDESGALAPNTLFSAGKYRQHWLTYSLLNLLAQVNHPLVAQVKRVYLDGEIAKPALIDPPMHALKEFTNVQSLRLTFHPDSEIDLTVLTAMPKLTHLRLGATTSPALPSLDQLEKLTATTLTMPATNRWPKLEAATIDANFTGELTGSTAPALRVMDYMGSATLRKFKNLARVTVREPKKRKWGTAIPSSFLELDGCGEIDEVSLTDCALTINHVERIGDLTLSHCQGKDYRCLGNVGTVGAANLNEAGYHLGLALPPNTPVGSGGHVDLSSIKGRDLSVLRSLTGVKMLTIRQISEPMSLEPLRHIHTLQALDLRGSIGITDLSPLEELPDLRIIALQRTGVERIPGPVEAMVDLSTYPSFGRARRAEQSEPSADLSEEEALRAQLANAVRRANTDAVLRYIDVCGEARNTALIEEFLATFGRSNGEITARRHFGLIPISDRGQILGRLLRWSEPDSKAAKKWRKCTELRLRKSAGGTGRIMIDFLDELPALQRLEIRYAHDIDFERCEGTKLEELTLVCENESIAGAERIAELPIRKLRTTPCFDLRLLNDHQTLESLVLRGERAEIAIPSGLTVEPTFGFF